MTPLEPAGEPGVDGGGEEGDFPWTPDYGRQLDGYYGVPTYW